MWKVREDPILNKTIYALNNENMRVRVVVNGGICRER